MARDEVFPNPTVKQVIFQIRYPCLFFIEKLIGDYQLKVMEKFPESKLLVQRQFLIAQGPEEPQPPDLPEEAKAFPVRKIWQFAAPEGVTLNVQNESLDLVSKSHKTYSNPASDLRFRDLIEFAVGCFLNLANLPVISRMGLRYVDECPVPAPEDSPFQEYYATAFPLARFPLSDATEMGFTARVKRNDYFLLFQENYRLEEDDSPKLILVFDAYAENIKAGDYLSVADALHKLAADEYFRCIKQPVIEHMRQERR